MNISFVFLFILNIIEPIALAIFAQRRGHVGFFWFVAIFAAAAAYTLFVDGTVADDPNSLIDPSFYENIGQYRELGGFALGAFVLPLIVLLILFTWPKNRDLSPPKS
ncbi:hypothetical protein [Methylobacterium sp. PvR107]|uniref:hypothetical protein n=1 Tax=Methylobacterium sp. PvR107 TaxID=2806597 RepID=UPI001AE54C54|nr:hypothetical protein [Methylobacterium sp. PvR107]MBP1180019.1 hypothetical protein [Methylobacterium sp. PvR107]